MPDNAASLDTDERLSVSVDDSGSRLLEFEFTDVGKQFSAGGGDSFTAVEGVSLDIPPSTFTCVIGPSGCGKSTLLNMAAGLMRPTTGTVSYRAEPVAGINTDVGYLTQHDNLLPWRTVERNVGLALEIRGVKRSERRERVRSMLELVGLSGFERHYISQLSGGMQKRAAIAKTLIYNPTTLLLDEPFGALDAQLRVTMQRELLSMWEQSRSTVIFVTHDLDEAILLGDRVVVFGKNPGRIVHIEEIHFERPRDIIELRADPAFAEVWERLWRLLEDQMGPAK